MRNILVFLTMFFLIFVIFSGSVQGPGIIKEQDIDETYIVKNQLLVESGKITDIGMQAAKAILVRAFDENITEANVVEAAAKAMVDYGSSEDVEAFGVIVASGEQSALPHGDSSDDDTNQILMGEVVVVDLGARYRGYCTDLTRTFFMGEPTEEMKEVYNIIMEAQDMSMAAVRSGALAREVDRVARDIISDHGYGENFTHGLGHGIGLYVHMPPTLQPSSNEILFQSGDMAITIEPGIYLDGRWGIRIEDNVLVKRNGFDLITHFPKGLDEAILYSEGYSNSSKDENKLDFQDIQNIYTMLIVGSVSIIVAIIVTSIILKKYKRNTRH